MDCSGSTSCDEASITAGPAKGFVDCRGSCSGANIQNTQSVACTSEFACNGAELHNISDGGTVDCSGSYGCFGADIRPVPGGSISVDCSGPVSCSVAVINAGDSGTVDCSGRESCRGNFLVVDFTVVSSQCLSCATGACAYPCTYVPPGTSTRLDCLDGSDNGDCSKVMNDGPTNEPPPAICLPSNSASQFR